MSGKVYRVGPIRRWIMVLIFSPFALALLALAWSQPGPAIAISFVTVPFVLLGQWAIAYARLEITSEGVSVRQLGYTLTAGWEDIDCLYTVPGREGFATKSPMTGKGVNRLRRTRHMAMAGAPTYDDNQTRWMAEGRFIPIDAFNHALRKGDLHEEIEKWLPSAESD